MTQSALPLVTPVLGLLLVAGCSPRPTNPADPANSATTFPAASPLADFSAHERAIIATMSPLPPLPPDPTNTYADDPRAATLGQFLFFDKRLSKGGTVSCASCHVPERGFTDGERLPDRFSKDLRHVPALWNVAYNRWYFWDGRADSLWSQALDPMEAPDEHAGSRRDFASLVATDKPLREAYEAIFGPLPAAAESVAAGKAALNAEETLAIDRLFANLGKSIAAYERKLISRDSAFDRFAAGLRSGDDAKLAQLSPSARRGLKLFIGRANCRSCHHGANFTDSEFHDTGVADLDETPIFDTGRFRGISRLLANPFNAVGPFSDGDPKAQPTAFLINMVDRRGQFKTPTLRNSAITAPYMHRGQFATLEEVVRFYSTLESPTASTAAPSDIASSGRPRKQPVHDHGAAEHVLAPLHLSRTESEDLVEFLRALTDDAIDPALKRAPPSPSLGR